VKREQRQHRFPSVLRGGALSDHSLKSLSCKFFVTSFFFCPENVFDMLTTIIVFCLWIIWIAAVILLKENQVLSSASERRVYTRKFWRNKIALLRVARIHKWLVSLRVFWLEFHCYYLTIWLWKKFSFVTREAAQQPWKNWWKYNKIIAQNVKLITVTTRNEAQHPAP